MLLVVAALALMLSGILVALALAVYGQSDDDDDQGARQTPDDPSGGPRAVPPQPAWAKVKLDKSNEDVQYIKRTVAEANAGGQRFDMVMLGDSITANLQRKYAESWAKHFGSWKAAPLGVGGFTVEELTAFWGTYQGRLAKDPRCIVILVGINNLKWSKTTPEDKLDFFLQWVKAVHPTSRVIVMGVLPNVHVSVAATNAKYRALAAKHDVIFSDCGSDTNPHDSSQYRDGTHPNEGGYDRILQCLKPQLAAA